MVFAWIHVRPHPAVTRVCAAELRIPAQRPFKAGRLQARPLAFREGEFWQLTGGLLQHYLDLAVAHPELASRDESLTVDVRYAWFAAQALTTAQTLWLLVRRKANWQRSINAILRQHGSYLRSGMFQCGDFSPEFVDYLRTRVADLKCAESNDGEGAPS